MRRQEYLQISQRNEMRSHVEEFSEKNSPVIVEDEEHTQNEGSIGVTLEIKEDV